MCFKNGFKDRESMGRSDTVQKNRAMEVRDYEEAWK